MNKKAERCAKIADAFHRVCSIDADGFKEVIQALVEHDEGTLTKMYWNHSELWTKEETKEFLEFCLKDEWKL